MTLATTNFSRINVLAVDEDHFSTDILGQMLREKLIEIGRAHV